MVYLVMIAISMIKMITLAATSARSMSCDKVISHAPLSEMRPGEQLPNPKQQFLPHGKNCDLL